LEDRTAPAILAAPISLSVVHGQAVSALLSDYVSGANSTPTIALGTALHGSASLDGANLMTYQSSVNYAGIDTVVYSATDSTDTSSATITLNVTETVPTVQAQTEWVTHDQPLSSDLSTGVTNPDGAALQYSVVTGPANGTLALDAGGTYTFTPNAGFAGTDSFTFKANDRIADSNTATVTITVVNHAPVIGPDIAYSRFPNTGLLWGDLTANATDADGDRLSVVIDSFPSHGSLAYGHGTYDVRFSYAPYTDYTGPDSFTYHVPDGIASSATITVSITAVDTAIIANPVLAKTNMNTEGLIVSTPENLVVACTLNSSSYSFSSFSSPSHGTVTVDVYGRFIYEPNEGYVGKDLIPYTITDGTNFATSMIEVNVQAPPGLTALNRLSGEIDTRLTGTDTGSLDFLGAKIGATLTTMENPDTTRAQYNELLTGSLTTDVRSAITLGNQINTRATAAVGLALGEQFRIAGIWSDVAKRNIYLGIIADGLQEAKDDLPDQPAFQQNRNSLQTMQDNLATCALQNGNLYNDNINRPVPAGTNQDILDLNTTFAAMQGLVGVVAAINNNIRNIDAQMTLAAAGIAAGTANAQADYIALTADLSSAVNTNVLAAAGPLMVAGVDVSAFALAYGTDGAMSETTGDAFAQKGVKQVMNNFSTLTLGIFNGYLDQEYQMVSVQKTLVDGLIAQGKIGGGDGTLASVELIETSLFNAIVQINGGL
jgi:hypothetical protein